MLQNHISGLPVINRSGALVGVVTEGDFLRRSETATERKRPRWLEFLMGPRRLADEYVHAHARRVERCRSLRTASNRFSRSTQVERDNEL
jgi:CBS domain-containing protein